MKNFLARTVFFCCFLLFLSRPGITAAQSVEEIKFNGEPSPVSIIGYEFGTGHNRLKDMVVEVKNTSSKPVYYFFYIGTVLRDSAEGKPIRVHLLFNEELQQELTKNKRILDSTSIKPLMPGETVKLSPAQKFKTGLATLSETSSVKKINLFLQHAFYGDGTYWTGGATLPRKADAPSDKKPDDAEQR